jgi:hypothetical protein
MRLMVMFIRDLVEGIRAGDNPREVFTGLVKANTTNAHDNIASRPRGKTFARIVFAWVPDDWFNYFF